MQDRELLSWKAWHCSRPLSSLHCSHLPEKGNCSNDGNNCSFCWWWGNVVSRRFLMTVMWVKVDKTWCQVLTCHFPLPLLHSFWHDQNGDWKGRRGCTCVMKWSPCFTWTSQRIVHTTHGHESSQYFLVCRLNIQSSWLTHLWLNLTSFNEITKSGHFFLVRDESWKWKSLFLALIFHFLSLHTKRQSAFFCCWKMASFSNASREMENGTVNFNCAIEKCTFPCSSFVWAHRLSLGFGCACKKIKEICTCGKGRLLTP